MSFKQYLVEEVTKGLDDAIVRKVTADNCRALYRF